MNKTDIIKNYCKQLKLSAIPQKLDSILMEAEKAEVSYLEYTHLLLDEEIKQRQENDVFKRKKAASLPLDL